MRKLELGVQAKDKITGFEGIVTSEVNYLTGCKQFGLAPKMQDGKIQNTEYFDFTRLEVTGDGILPSEVQQPKNLGGINRDSPSY